MPKVIQSEKEFNAAKDIIVAAMSGQDFSLQKKCDSNNAGIMGLYLFLSDLIEASPEFGDVCGATDDEVVGERAAWRSVVEMVDDKIVPEKGGLFENA